MTGATANTKSIGNVHNARLQFAGADAGEPVDAEGYPTDFEAVNYFVR